MGVSEKFVTKKNKFNSYLKIFLAFLTKSSSFNLYFLQNIFQKVKVNPCRYRTAGGVLRICHTKKLNFLKFNEK